MTDTPGQPPKQERLAIHTDSGEAQEKALAALTLLDVLKHDHRPSFAIDVQHGHNTSEGPVKVVYHNPALRAVDGLLATISGQQDATSVFGASSALQLAFWAWLRGTGHENDAQRRGHAYIFEGHVWSATSVNNYSIVSGMPTLRLWTNATPGGRLRDARRPRDRQMPKHKPIAGTAPALPPTTDWSVSSNGEAPTASPVPSATKYGPFDYTLESLPSAVRFDPHIVYFRSVAWEKTPLGPMSSWSADIRSTVNAVLNNSFPAVLFWGDDVIMIYNETYVQLLGALHPCMGKSIRTEAPDHWPSFEPLVDYINETGRSLAEDSMLLYIDRHGFSEETHWSFQFVPVLDSSGCIAAYFQSFYEITDHRLLERRVLSLVEMGSQSADARDLESFWKIALHALTLNDKDIPFALLYAAERHISAEASTVSSPGSTLPLEKCVFRGCIGADAGHPIAPSTINLDETSYLFHPFLVQAAKSRQATIVQCDELLSRADALRDINWKGHGEPSRTFVICPILPTTSEQVEGFLILGTNPRRPFDEQYKRYIQVMLRLLATSLASIVLFDAEVRQREIAIGQAARIQEQLLAEIQLRENKFQRFAERSDVGIFVMDSAGNYTYRNQRWFDLFDIAATEDDVATAWRKIVFPEDLEFCEGIFTKLVVDKEPAYFELRTRMSWIPPSGLTPSAQDSDKTFNKYIMCSAYPEFDSNGNLVEIVGNVTDISKLKWAEGIQKSRTESALEGKQHLEVRSSRKHDRDITNLRSAR